MKYLTTETEIGQQAGVPVPPIRLITTEGLGVDLAALRARLADSWERLPWDMYDVRRAHIDALVDAHPDHAARLRGWAPGYFAGTNDLDQVGDLVDALPTSVLASPAWTSPGRRRSVAAWRLQHVATGWEIRPQPHQPFAQAGDHPDDYRTLPREFAATDPEVTDSPEYRALLTGVADIVDDIQQGRVTTLLITCHQIGVVARDTGATNSPEGLHQDGADSIVSALVIDRDNVAGAESLIYLDADTNTPTGQMPGLLVEVFRHTLTEGQGLYQADRGSPLWHEVTPVRPADPTRPAVRNILGFDIELID